jgi:hypothetical protein
MAHIQLGHRGLTNITQTGIKATVETPTRVYLSAESPNRFLFHSTDVQTKSGKPLMVVVERQAARGRVITASPHPKPQGQMLWESSGSIYSSYDPESDLFYLSKGAATDTYVNAEEAHIWFRVADSDDTPLGVTVFDLKSFWRENKSDLISKISNFLMTAPKEIELRVENALGR